MKNRFRPARPFYMRRAIESGIHSLRLEFLEDRLVLSCDLNLDGQCTTADLDEIYDSAWTTTDTAADVDGNGQVNLEDVDAWLNLAAAANDAEFRYMSGDINLDGQVDSTDLGLALNNFNSNATQPGDGVGWGGGDVDMNGRVNSDDLGRLLNSFGHTNVFLKETSTQAAEAVNSFAADIYQRLQQEDGNVVFSPLSISTALAMTYAGTAGQTADEIASVFHFGDDPEIHESFRSLLAGLNGSEYEREVSVANSIWPHVDYPPTQEFVDQIATDYGGAAQALDYLNDPGGAEDTINEWISDATNGRIEDLLQDDLTPSTVMVLINALYFQGFWDSPFSPDATSLQPFTTASGSSVNVPMMAGQPSLAKAPPYAGLPFTSIDGFQVVEMPFEGRDASMVIMLPDRDTPNDLSSETIFGVNEWLDSGEQTLECLYLQVPRFETTVTTDLSDVLIDMGMPTAFMGGDFTPMLGPGGDGIFIDEVKHKAFLNVNEQGTEAAAATSVELVACFAAGTPVLTPDGLKPIEKLQVGDYVLSRDESDVNGTVRPKVIEEVFHGHKHVLQLQIGGRMLKPTDAHPFFVRDRGWMPAGDLQVGDLVATHTGDWLMVDYTAVTGEVTHVYNFRVADYHTYFVGDGESAIWTHNVYTEFTVDRPFHFMIRDNVSSATLFMGRIDDPTQASNEIGGDASSASRAAVEVVPIVPELGRRVSAPGPSMIAEINDTGEALAGLDEKLEPCVGDYSYASFKRAIDALVLNDSSETVHESAVDEAHGADEIGLEWQSDFASIL